MTSKHPLPGRLIAVEGLDGSGKSTQIRLLHRWLKSQGLKVFFSEWNSSPIVKGATKRGKKAARLTPTTFSLMHAADFADRYERQILPMLKAGYIVLCDRYIFTALARDGTRGCDRDWVLNLYGRAALPDLTLYYRLPLETALGRILSGRPALKFYEAGMDLDLAPTREDSFRIFQGRIFDQYEQLTKDFEFTVLDSSQDIVSLQEDTRKAVQEVIDLSAFKYNGGGK